MDNTANNLPKKIENDEIDLLALAKTLWNGRITVIKSVLVFMVIGVIVALLSPSEYTASTVLVPQVHSGKSSLGGLSNLASLAGIDLNSGNESSELLPSSYPQIVQSIPFKLELMQTQITISGFEKPVSYFNYYTELAKPGVLGLFKKYTIGLPGVIIKAIKGEPNQGGSMLSDSLIRLNVEEQKLAKLLSSQISLNLNDKEGYITLTASMPEALPAAQLTMKAQELLQQYITRFKIEKAKANLDFIQSRYNENKKEFESAQTKLAIFRDRNYNVISAVARTEEERLTSEYQIAFNVYSELAKQLEQAKIQVKKETPVFTIVEPVTVPTERTKPKRAMIVLIWTFLGGIAGLGIVFGKEYLVSLKKLWKEN